jgi:hypothetical protein
VRKSGRPIEDDVNMVLESCKNLRNLKILNHTVLATESLWNVCAVIEKTIGDLRVRTSKSWWKTFTSLVALQFLSWLNAFTFVGQCFCIFGAVVFTIGLWGLSLRDMTTVLAFGTVSVGAFTVAAPYSEWGLVCLVVITMWISLYHLVDERVDQVREV